MFGMILIEHNKLVQNHKLMLSIFSVGFYTIGSVFTANYQTLIVWRDFFPSSSWINLFYCGFLRQILDEGKHMVSQREVLFISVLMAIAAEIAANCSMQQLSSPSPSPLSSHGIRSLQSGLVWSALIWRLVWSCSPLFLWPRR